MSCRTFVECGKESLVQLLSLHAETKRDDEPRINGSFAAFIAVIVGLVFIITVSCIAILLLLRDHKISDEERVHGTKRSYQSSPSSPTSSYNLNDASSHIPWTKRLGALFHRPDLSNKSRPRQSLRGNRFGGGGGHCWIQTGSTEEWVSDVRNANNPDMRTATPSTPSSLQTTLPPSALSRPVSRATSDSLSSYSVRFDLNAIRGLQYPERRPSTHSTLPNIHSQLSSPTGSLASSPVPFRTTSPESIIPEGLESDELRYYSTPSGVVMRTLPGGTKFIEAL